MTWRRDFVRTYLERDIPFFDARVPAETLRRPARGRCVVTRNASPSRRRSEQD